MPKTTPPTGSAARNFSLACMLTTVLLAPLAAPAQQAAVAPDLPAAADAAVLAGLSARASQVLDVFSNEAPAYVPGGKYVVYTSNRDGLSQVYRANPGRPREAPVQLTRTHDRVRGALPLPDGSGVLFVSDKDANERWSIFKVGIDGGEPVELTTEPGLIRDLPIIPAGQPGTMYFSVRNPGAAGATLYAKAITHEGEARRIWADSAATGMLLDVTDDGRQALWLSLHSISDTRLSVVDLRTGVARAIYPGTGRKVFFLAAAFSRDGHRIYLGTDDGGEQSSILVLDYDGKVLGRHADITPATAATLGLCPSPDGKTVVLTLNAGDQSRLQLLDAASLELLREFDLPVGSGGTAACPYAFSADGSHLLGTWSTPASPSDLYRLDLRQGGATPLLVQPRPGLDALPELTTESVTIDAPDGLKLPLLVHRPTGDDGKRPVIVFFHGGPAANAVAKWNPMVRYFTSLGYAVMEPNVRGSLGFGRAYEAADNTRERPKVFDDMRAVATWVGRQPWADADRLVIAGGSYGGYLTLNGITRQPDLWAAAVDMYGPADLRTLLATTAPSMRPGFAVEFGEPGKDDDFLASISPITHVERIEDPLFVYAGANDPRVPRAESDAIVAAARRQGVPVEYMVADDEGHSLAREANQIEFYSRVALFLDRHLNEKAPSAK